jgi:protein translocase SecG subunit
MALFVAQILISIALVVVILLQRQSSELGGAFGGSSSEFFHARRGTEKYLFRATIVLAILFLASAVLNLVL